jgi:hypothetical protein
MCILSKYAFYFKYIIKLFKKPNSCARFELYESMFELLCARFELQMFLQEQPIRLFVLIGLNNNNQILRMAVLAQPNPGVVDFGATITIFCPKQISSWLQVHV